LFGRKAGRVPAAKTKMKEYLETKIATAPDNDLTKYYFY
jgi:hypothetical protein